MHWTCFKNFIEMCFRIEFSGMIFWPKNVGFAIR